MERHRNSSELNAAWKEDVSLLLLASSVFNSWFHSFTVPWVAENVILLRDVVRSYLFICSSSCFTLRGFLQVDFSPVCLSMVTLYHLSDLLAKTATDDSSELLTEGVFVRPHGILLCFQSRR